MKSKQISDPSARWCQGGRSCSVLKGAIRRMIRTCSKAVLILSKRCEVVSERVEYARKDIMHLRESDQRHDACLCRVKNLVYDYFTAVPGADVLDCHTTDLAY
jgi:hypothetical protein